MDRSATRQDQPFTYDIDVRAKPPMRVLNVVYNPDTTCTIQDPPPQPPTTEPPADAQTRLLADAKAVVHTYDRLITEMLTDARSFDSQSMTELEAPGTDRYRGGEAWAAPLIEANHHITPAEWTTNYAEGSVQLAGSEGVPSVEVRFCPIRPGRPPRLRYRRDHAHHL